MKRIQPEKALLFFASFGIIAIAINCRHPLTQNTERRAASPSDSWAAVQKSINASASKETANPSIVRPVLWPNDVAPTKVIKIPDPENPRTGVMENLLQPGDELELQVTAPWYLIYFSDFPQKFEMAINRGSGYVLFDAPSNSNLHAPAPTQSRVVRIRPRTHIRESMTLKLIVQKESNETNVVATPVP